MLLCILRWDDTKNISQIREVYSECFAFHRKNRRHTTRFFHERKQAVCIVILCMHKTQLHFFMEDYACRDFHPKCHKPSL